MFTIREDGKNGSVVITPDSLERTIKKRLGKDDRQVIPLKGITSVQQDRKRLKTDEVTVITSGAAYTWKVSKAEKFVDELNRAIAALLSVVSVVLAPTGSRTWSWLYGYAPRR